MTAPTLTLAGPEALAWLEPLVNLAWERYEHSPNVVRGRRWAALHAAWDGLHDGPLTFREVAS